MAKANAKRPGPEARKKQILEAAVDVFGEKNYHWATTKEISDRAGLSERMVFFYFNNKKELYREASKVIAGEIADATLRGNPPIDDIRTFIKMSLRNFMTYLRENPMKVKFLLQSLDVLEDEDMKEDLKGIMEGFYQLIHSFLEEAQKRGKIEKDVKIDTVTVFFLGLIILVSYAEFLGIDWFTRGEGDIFTVGDYFVDAVS